ncbi:MAG: hypothetical protein WDN69_11430 [Aliidongia sp.]
MSKVLFGAMLVAATTAQAFADAPAGIPVNSAVVHSMDGKTTIVPISGERQAELLASPHAHQLASGIVVLVAGGKTYVIDDHIMPSGKEMIKTVLDEFVQQGGG